MKKYEELKNQVEENKKDREQNPSETISTFKHDEEVSNQACTSRD